jgi:predicted RNase H-like nuclease (RuvC/YqgF family)
MELDDARNRDDAGSGGHNDLESAVSELKGENEIFRIQLMSRERDIEELKKEVDELHDSISYKIGKRIAETWLGVWIKSVLKKYVFR